MLCLHAVVTLQTRLPHRLLETDSKSLRSMNGSRRNSGSSLVSSSSASSNLSHLEEDSWILWGRIVNEWEEVRKKKEKQLKVRVVQQKDIRRAVIAYRDYHLRMSTILSISQSIPGPKLGNTSANDILDWGAGGVNPFRLTD